MRPAILLRAGLLGLAFLAPAIQGCQLLVIERQQSEQPPPSGARLLPEGVHGGASWKLVSATLHGAQTAYAPGAPGTPRLDFTDSRPEKISGSLGCNGFSGVIADAGGGKLRVDSLGSTLMACLSPTLESVSGAFLGSPFTLELASAGRIVLRGTFEGDPAELVFER